MVYNIFINLIVFDFMNDKPVEENKRLMKTLDDSWKLQDWNTFARRHA